MTGASSPVDLKIGPGGDLFFVDQIGGAVHRINYTGSTSDTTPPIRSNGSPNGTLALGTTQTMLSLATDENASCRYATSGGVAYSSMVNFFTTTGGTAHSTTVTGLTDGGSYNYFVRCQDLVGNVNTADFAIVFAVAAPDTTPPVRANGSPTGMLAAGTTQTTLTLSTSENASCRYSTIAGVAYGSMTSVFATTSGAVHSTTVTGLTNGNSYSYFIRCQDIANNTNPDDFTINFSVAQVSAAGLVAAYGFSEGTGSSVSDATGKGYTGTLANVAWTPAGSLATR